MAYNCLDNSEESSFSKDLLPEELTNVWDRGNEQNWLKGRKSRDPDSIADINEFLSVGASYSVDDSFKSAEDDNSTGILNDTTFIDPYVFQSSNASFGPPILEQTLIENVSPPYLYYKSHELTLSVTPSPPKYADESNNRCLRNLDPSLKKTTLHFFNNDIGSDVSPKSMSAKNSNNHSLTPDHVERVSHPSTYRISGSKITDQSMNVAHQIIKEDRVDDFLEVPELAETLVGTHKSRDPVEDVSTTFSFDNSFDGTVVAQHGSVGDIDMVLCSGDQAVQHCSSILRGRRLQRYDTFTVPPPGIFRFEESEREFSSQPETNQCRALDSTITCERSNSNDFLLVCGLDESLTPDNCDSITVEGLNTTYGFESSFNQTVVARNYSDFSFEKDAANQAEQLPCGDLDTNSCSGEQVVEQRSSIPGGRRLLRSDTFTVPSPGLCLLDKSERKLTAQSQPKTSQCLAVESRETREKDQLRSYEFPEVSCLGKTLTPPSFESGSDSMDNTPIILGNSCDETLSAQSKSDMRSEKNAANNEQQQPTDQHHYNDAGEINTTINFGCSWDALITKNGSENSAGKNVQQPACVDLDISSGKGGPVKVSCGFPIPRHVMPLRARCHPEYDQRLTVEYRESNIRGNSRMKAANYAQKSECDDLGVISSCGEPVKMVPFGKEERELMTPRTAVESGEIRELIDPSSGRLQIRQPVLGSGGAVSKPQILSNSATSLGRTSGLDSNSNAWLKSEPPKGERAARGAQSKIPVRKCPLLRSSTVLHSMAPPSETRSLSKITPSPSLPNLSTSLNPARKLWTAREQKK